MQPEFGRSFLLRFGSRAYGGVGPCSSFSERTFTMSISHQDVGADLRRITISGRLDMPGTDSVSARLLELIAEPKKSVVVDLRALRFLASIGIGALISSAKAVQQRGGKLVLVVAEGSTVSMSLEATGVHELIPVFSNSVDAEQAAVR